MRNADFGMRKKARGNGSTTLTMKKQQATRLRARLRCAGRRKVLSAEQRVVSGKIGE